MEKGQVNIHFKKRRIAYNDTTYEVSVTVKNTGEFDGKEVVELYVSGPDNKAANKPVKELKAFAKTKLLKPGESETVTLNVKAADLASFDETGSAWVVIEGDYEFILAASALDIKATLNATVQAQQTKANDVMKPNVKLNLLHR